MIDFDSLKSEVLIGKNLDFYSHVIVCQNSISNALSYMYVDNGRSVNQEISRILNLKYSNLKILGIFSYNDDLENQFKEFEKRNGNNSLEDKALLFATRMHEGQFRNDGTPYIEHPKRVANYVKKFKKNSQNLDILVSAAILHDTLEDTNLTFYDLVEFFNPQIASLVVELTTDEDFKKSLGKTRYLEYKCKNMSSWALTIKLCDRLDNVSDLGKCDRSFREKYSLETFNVIEYLINNRILNKTHFLIIREILSKLNEIVHLVSNEVKEKNYEVNELVKRKIA